MGQNRSPILLGCLIWKECWVMQGGHSLTFREREHRRYRYSWARLFDGCAWLTRRYLKLYVLAFVAFIVSTAPLLINLNNAQMGSMHPPMPLCRSRASCVSEFVRTSARVFKTPPVWDLEKDFAQTFGKYQRPKISDTNTTLSNILCAIIAETDDMEGVEAIYDTWGNPASSGMPTNYVLGDHHDNSRPYMLPPASLRITIQDAGVSSGIHTSDRNISEWFGKGKSKYEGLKSIEMIYNSFTDHQHRAIKAIRYLYDKEDSIKWYFLAHDKIMAFPSMILKTVQILDPAIPIIISHVATTSDEPMETSSTHRAILDNMYKTDGGTTYPTLSTGMIVSRAAMRVLSERIGRKNCRFWVSTDLTIARCAWRVGIYIANYRRFLPAVELPPPPQRLYPYSTLPMKLCTDTVSAHFMEQTYRTRWVECNLMQKWEVLG